MSPEEASSPPYSIQGKIPIPTVKAVSVAAFDASIGVNVHLTDNAGPFGNLPMIENELKYLGVNQIRDNQPYDWSLPFYQAIAATGVKLDLIIGYNPGETMNTADLQADLALIDKIAMATPGSIIGVESLNGPSTSPTHGTVNSPTTGRP